MSENTSSIDNNVPEDEPDSPFAQADEELQLRLIYLFVEGNSGKINEMNKALEDNDIVLAHRLAHTLKSQAGLMGKTDLLNAAREVEVLLKSGVNRVSADLMTKLDTELQKVMQEYTAILGDL